MPLSKYQQLAQELRSRIKRGEFVSGTRLPSYRALCEMFEVSEITVRHAVALLVKDGWLTGKRGRGNGFFINRPEYSLRGESGNLRRIVLYIRWPMMASSDSDLPELQKHLMQAAHAFGYGLELLPRQTEAEMLAMLKLWHRNERPDGLIMLPQFLEPTLELVDCFRKYNQRFLLLNTAQMATADQLRVRKVPGIYTDELTPLRRMLAVARARGIRSIQIVGTVQEALHRTYLLCKWLDAEPEFQIEIQALNLETLAEEFRHQITLAAGNRRRLVLIEGTGLMLITLDAILNLTGLKPGRDVSIAFVQHYCDLREYHPRRYTSLTRPFDRFARAAVEQLVDQIRNNAPERQFVIPAVFNDAGTI